MKEKGEEKNNQKRKKNEEKDKHTFKNRDKCK